MMRPVRYLLPGQRKNRRRSSGARTPKNSSRTRSTILLSLTASAVAIIPSETAICVGRYTVTFTGLRSIIGSILAVYRVRWLMRGAPVHIGVGRRNRANRRTAARIGINASFFAVIHARKQVVGQILKKGWTWNAVCRVNIHGGLLPLAFYASQP